MALGDYVVLTPLEVPQVDLGAVPARARPSPPAIITASRSVIFAFEGKAGDWKSHVEAGAKDLKAQIQAILR